MEKFFIKSFTVDEITEELLLRRYNNIDYILNKDFESGFRLIEVAHEKDIEEKLWQQWLALYPNMTADNFISFEDFKSETLIKNAVLENKSKDEILADVSDIINLTLDKEVG